MNCFKDWDCYSSGLYQYVWSDWINHHPWMWGGLLALIGVATMVSMGKVKG
jgi:hypothetical protein